MSRYFHGTLGAEKLCFINIFCHRAVRISSRNLFAASSEIAFILHVCWQRVREWHMYSATAVMRALFYVLHISN